MDTEQMRSEFKKVARESIREAVDEIGGGTPSFGGAFKQAAASALGWTLVMVPPVAGLVITTTLIVTKRARTL